MNGQQASPRNSWLASINVDVLAKVLNNSIFHPFICWLIPICFRAEHQAWDTKPMIVSIVWAALVTIGWMANVINQRIAYGLHREVDLSEEVIVITGGASGIGLLIAEVYGMRGATVAVLDPAEMENTEGRGIVHYKCDVGDKAQVAKVAADIKRDLGNPTVLINNAAIVVGKKLLDMKIEEAERSLSTNLLAHFYTIKEFLPGMVESEVGGTIVTISSVLGVVGASQLTDYAAAKAGVAALHKSLAAELRHEYPEIKTVLVTPGQLGTPLFDGVRTPNSFLAPVVEPIDIAKEIIRVVDLGLSDHIAMPFYARYIDWFNVLPSGAQIIYRAAAGIDRSMLTFVGRGAKNTSTQKKYS